MGGVIQSFKELRKRARCRPRLTQARVAALVSIDPATLCKWESGAMELPLELQIRLVDIYCIHGVVVTVASLYELRGKKLVPIPYALTACDLWLAAISTLRASDNKMDATDASTPDARIPGIVHIKRVRTKRVPYEKPCKACGVVNWVQKETRDNLMPDVKRRAAVKCAVYGFEPRRRLYQCQVCGHKQWDILGID